MSIQRTARAQTPSDPANIPNGILFFASALAAIGIFTLVVLPVASFEPWLTFAIAFVAAARAASVICRLGERRAAVTGLTWRRLTSAGYSVLLATCAIAGALAVTGHVPVGHSNDLVRALFTAAGVAAGIALSCRAAAKKDGEPRP